VEQVKGKIINTVTLNETYELNTSTGQPLIMLEGAGWERRREGQAS
jgi:hypothetical protein